MSKNLFILQKDEKTASLWILRIAFWPFIMLTGYVIYALSIYGMESGFLFTGCPLFTVTGFYCAGCGGTRAFTALLHGKILQAFAYNPLVPFLILPCTYLVTAWGIFAISDKAIFKISEHILRKILIFSILILVFIILFSVARNIPFYPFTILAPHELYLSKGN